MKKFIYLLTAGVILIALSACGNDNNSNSGGNDMNDEVKVLNTEYDQPDSADVGETVTLKGIVTLGEEGEKITDADVKFEYWPKGNEDDSTTIEADNNDDGTYTADVVFDEAGTYKMYVHTTAEGQHTMPTTEITIGDADSESKADNE